MVMDVEIELRVPTLTVKKDDGQDTRINNQHVRFRKRVPVPEFPQPGSKIKLSAGSDVRFEFECTVMRADWHEEKQLFVLACKYPNTRIFSHEYDALLHDPQWERTELPS
jgi:hypothetical protein